MTKITNWKLCSDGEVCRVCGKNGRGLCSDCTPKLTEHWLTTALSRVRAGEPEKDVMRDYGYERSEEPFNHDPAEGA